MNTPIIYRILTSLLPVVESIGAIFNEKLKRRKKGLKDLNSQLQLISERSEKKELLWCHCSSLGEYEQAIPVLELLKQNKKDAVFVLVSFYSASGYDYCKEAFWLDQKIYLPPDNQANVINFVSILEPAIVLWTKYDFWFNYFVEIQKNRIPLVLFSASFRADNYFFKSYVSKLLEILRNLNIIFVQDEKSIDLMHYHSFDNVKLAGDTRIDRVIKRKNKIKVNEDIVKFCKKREVIIFASTHNEDIPLLQEFISNNSTDKILIFPHDINTQAIKGISSVINEQFSVLSKGVNINDRILIVDSVGMLFDTYSIADIVYVGGGFGTSIHNILEPTVFGVPTFIGPNFEKFKEARDLVALDLVKRVKDKYDFWNQYNEITKIDFLRIKKGLQKYYNEEQGATEIIGNHILALMNKR